MSASIVPRDGSGPSYNPGRDVTYFLPRTLKRALEELRDKPEGWMFEHAASCGVSENQIAEAAVAFAMAMQRFHQTDNGDSPHDFLEQAGFFKKPVAAQMIVVAKIGQLVTGMYFHGVRTVTPLGGTPPGECDYQGLALAAAKLSSSLVRQSRWRRLVRWIRYCPLWS